MTATSPFVAEISELGPSESDTAYIRVHDMTIRCMIDAGARIGRSLTGKTGQTLEIASFKHMRRYLITGTALFLPPSLSLSLSLSPPSLSYQL